MLKTALNLVQIKKKKKNAGLDASKMQIQWLIK